jgi:hypothetical protein
VAQWHLLLRKAFWRNFPQRHGTIHPTTLAPSTQGHVLMSRKYIELFQTSHEIVSIHLHSLLPQLVFIVLSVRYLCKHLSAVELPFLAFGLHHPAADTAYRRSRGILFPHLPGSYTQWMAFPVWVASLAVDRAALGDFVPLAEKRLHGNNNGRV